MRKNCKFAVMEQGEERKNIKYVTFGTEISLKSMASHELAKELGYDAGFGMNTYADDVASFVAQEFVRRKNK